MARAPWPSRARRRPVPSRWPLRRAMTGSRAGRAPSRRRAARLGTDRPLGVRRRCGGELLRSVRSRSGSCADAATICSCGLGCPIGREQLVRAIRRARRRWAARARDVARVCVGDARDSARELRSGSSDASPPRVWPCMRRPHDRAEDEAAERVRPRRRRRGALRSPARSLPGHASSRLGRRALRAWARATRSTMTGSFQRMRRT